MSADLDWEDSYGGGGLAMSMAERLALVMARVGARNLSAFYGAISGGAPEGFPTYEAARTYHGKQLRDPPTVYLARILEVYPVFDARWLITGLGSPYVTPEPVQSPSPERALLKRIAEACEQIARRTTCAGCA